MPDVFSVVEVTASYEGFYSLFMAYLKERKAVSGLKRKYYIVSGNRFINFVQLVKVDIQRYLT